MNEDEDAYIRQRTNEILRQRIALGMIGAGDDMMGGARHMKRSGSKAPKRKSTKKCPPGKSARRSYMRADGTRVKASCVKKRKVARKPVRKVARKPVRKVVRKTTKRTSPWIKFVKQWAQHHGISYGEALREASPHYKYHTH